MLTELQCWLDCYGEPLTLGAMVKVTEDCEKVDLVGKELMVTFIYFEDEEGVNIGVNADGRKDDFITAHMGFRITELELISETVYE